MKVRAFSAGLSQRALTIVLALPSSMQSKKIKSIQGE
jgi:hypothetical protein